MKELFEIFTHHLHENAYYMPTGNEPMDDRSRLFAMYHKKTHKTVKDTVEKEFCKSNGTIAFGMGVNIKMHFWICTLVLQQIWMTICKKPEG